MADRRVLRPHVAPSRNAETISPVPTRSFVSRFFRCVWHIVYILWYWIERIFLILFLLGLTVGLAWWTSQKPSLYRDWEKADAILPTLQFSGDTVTIHNIRDHQWISEKEFVPRYFDASYNISDIEKMYYIITPFSDRDGPAHTMFSFTFSGGRHIVISPEIRKERGEGFDALRGILNQFEMQYVIATEEDVIRLRTNYRKNQVYMYPINTPRENIAYLFRSMLIRADKLSREPEFYNTLWNNCATSILAHTNALRKEKFSSWTRYIILPSHSDEIPYGDGLIDTQLPLSEARLHYRIDEIARANTGSTFSDIIRVPVQ